MDMESTLTKIGLTQKQAKVYLTLLGMGSGTAYEVARRGGMKRPTVYIILEELREKNLVLKTPQANKQLYQVRDPQQFVAERVQSMQQTIASTNDLLPQLYAVMPQNHKPNMLYFDGWEGIRSAKNYFAEHIANEEEVISFYAYTPQDELPAIPKEFPEMIATLFSQLQKKQCTMRAIQPLEGSTQEQAALFKQYDVEVIGVPHKFYDSIVSCSVSETCTMIISRQYRQAMIIENREIARMYRQVFNMVWQFAQMMQFPHITE